MSGAFVKRYDKNLATKLRALRELTHPSICGDRRPSGMRVSSAPRRGGEASPVVWSRGTHRSLRSHRLHIRRESKSVPHPARLRSVSGRLAMRTASQWRLAGVAGSETIATCASSATVPGLSGTPPSPDFSRDATATSEAVQSAHVSSSTIHESFRDRLRCAKWHLDPDNCRDSLRLS